MVVLPFASIRLRACLLGVALVIAASPGSSRAQSAESLKVLREAAGHGNAAALYALGAQAEQNGDMRNALALYQQSALLGYHGAQYNLARVLETGKGVPQDFIAAEAWYRKAAEGNFAPAVARIQRLDAARRYERSLAEQANRNTPPATAASSVAVAPAPAAVPQAPAPPPVPVEWTTLALYSLAALLVIGAFVALPAFTGRRRGT